MKRPNVKTSHVQKLHPKKEFFFSNSCDEKLHFSFTASQHFRGTTHSIRVNVNPRCLPVCRAISIRQPICVSAAKKACGDDSSHPSAHRCECDVCACRVCVRVCRTCECVCVLLLNSNETRSQSINATHQPDGQINYSLCTLFCLPLLCAFCMQRYGTRGFAF